MYLSCWHGILLGGHVWSWCTTLSSSCTCLAGAAELRGDLERATGVELPATLAFDYPTPADAASALAVRMADAAHAADASIVEDLEPAAHILPLQQAFPETGISGNMSKSPPSSPLCSYLRFSSTHKKVMCCKIHYTLSLQDCVHIMRHLLQTNMSWQRLSGPTTAQQGDPIATHVRPR